MQSDIDHPPVQSSAPESLDLTPVFTSAISTLKYGFRAAAALFVAGLAWSALVGEEIAAHVTPIEQIPAELASGTPMAMIDLAFLTLMFTPVAAVMRVGVMFLQLGDRRYGTLSLFVLAILGASISIALLR